MLLLVCSKGKILIVCVCLCVRVQMYSGISVKQSKNHKAFPSAHDFPNEHVSPLPLLSVKGLKSSLISLISLTGSFNLEGNIGHGRKSEKRIKIKGKGGRETAGGKSCYICINLHAGLYFVSSYLYRLFTLFIYCRNGLK